ncbi:hypothetical protein NDU88_001918, partial [Pleurodeles waltl]
VNSHPSNILVNRIEADWFLRSDSEQRKGTLPGRTHMCTTRKGEQTLQLIGSSAESAGQRSVLKPPS